MTTAEPKLGTYIAVYLLLMAGLAATVGVSFVHLGPANLIAALAVAMAKAVLVVLFFMHVRYSPRLIWLATFAGTVWLAIMLAFVLADYATRNWIPTRPPAPLVAPSEAARRPAMPESAPVLAAHDLQSMAPTSFTGEMGLIIRATSALHERLD